MNKRVDWKSLKAELSSTNWVQLTQGVNVDGIHDRIYEKMFEISSKHLPLRRKVKKNGLPRDRKVMMRARKKIHNKLISETNEARIILLKNQSMEIEQDIINSHRNEARRNEERAVSCIKTNYKYFFNYARQKSRVNRGVAALEKNGQMVVEPKEKADLLLDQFDSVFSTPTHTEDQISEEMERDPQQEMPNIMLAN